MKRYRYNQAKFNVSVTLTGVFCLVLCVLAVLSIAGVITLIPAALGAFILIIAGYQVWNTFIAIANPQDVVIDDGSISFGAFGRTDRYSFDQITGFNVREMGGDAKVYVRVNGGGLLRGRYWLQLLYMNNGKELFKWIEDFEYKTDPDSLKARARRSSEEDKMGRKDDSAAPKSFKKSKKGSH